MTAFNSKMRSLFRVFGDDDFRVFLAIFRSYFPVYKYRYGLILLLIVVASNATALAAWLVRDVVNDLIVNKRGELLVPLFLGIEGLFLAKGISSYWQSVLSARIANDMVARTQDRIFSHI